MATLTLNTSVKLLPDLRRHVCAERFKHEEAAGVLVSVSFRLLTYGDE